MKKKYIVFCLILAFSTAVFYALPRHGMEVETTTVKIPLDAVIRNMSSQKNWAKWWPGNSVTDSTYEVNNSIILINKNLITGFYGKIFTEKLYTNIEMEFSAINEFETRFTIRLTHQFSNNIIVKLAQYLQLLKVKQVKNKLFKSITNFFSATNRVYGISILSEKLTQPFYIATKKDLNHYPSVTEVYTLLAKIQQYISANKGKAVNKPIIHIFKVDAANYRLMAAIATDTALPSANPFYLKKMVLGNVIVAEIIGGTNSVESGIKSLEHYLYDYKKMAAAIPFQRLVTNRSLEKDSSKWITKLYYPIY